MNDAEGKRADRNVVPTVSEVLADGTIVELVYNREEHTTQFAVYAAGQWSLEDRIETAGKVRLRSHVLCLPPPPLSFGSSSQETRRGSGARVGLSDNLISTRYPTRF